MSRSQPYKERAPSMQIVARRVDLRESFARSHAVAPEQRSALCFARADGEFARRDRVDADRSPLT